MQVKALSRFFGVPVQVLWNPEQLHAWRLRVDAFERESAIELV